MDLDTFLDKFNWIDRVEGLLYGATTLLPSRNLRGRIIISPGLFEIHTERYNKDGVIDYTGGDAERELARFSIPVHGKRVTGKEFIFVVPRVHAEHAEYILCRKGIQMGPDHVWFEPRNAQWAARHSDPQPAWSDRDKERIE